jgi:hypothetical protein
LDRRPAFALSLGQPGFEESMTPSAIALALLVGRSVRLCAAPSQPAVEAVVLVTGSEPAQKRTRRSRA